MIERLVLRRPPLGGDRVVPFLGIIEDRIDIEDHAAERIEAVADDLSDRELTCAIDLRRHVVGLSLGGRKWRCLKDERAPILKNSARVTSPRLARQRLTVPRQNNGAFNRAPGQAEFLARVDPELQLVGPIPIGDLGAAPYPHDLYPDECDALKPHTPSARTTI
jgi:hypothetical protein